MSRTTEIKRGRKRAKPDYEEEDDDGGREDAGTSTEAPATTEVGVGTDSHSGGQTGATGGTPYQPIALQRHLGNRKTRSGRFVYSGTTYVGSAFKDGYENVWYRFPWEFTQSAIRSWESLLRAERWLFWRAYRISIEFKNPMSIQDATVAASGDFTAGQNLHAQLFGYMDTLSGS